MNSQSKPSTSKKIYELVRSDDKLFGNYNSDIFLNLDKYNDEIKKFNDKVKSEILSNFIKCIEYKDKDGKVREVKDDDILFKEFKPIVRPITVKKIDDYKAELTKIKNTNQTENKTNDLINTYKDFINIFKCRSGKAGILDEINSMIENIEKFYNNMNTNIQNILDVIDRMETKIIIPPLHDANKSSLNPFKKTGGAYDYKKKSKKHKKKQSKRKHHSKKHHSKKHHKL